METRANFITVGVFVLAALIAGFAVVYWMQRYGESGNVVPVDIRIQGSVSGLAAGSVVQFNGIDVGRVSSLRLDPDDPRFVVVRAEVDRATPLRKDTGATVGIRGLSGGAFIQLQGGDPNSAPIIGGDGIPQIEGDPAVLTDLVDRVNRIANRAETMMSSLQGLVDENGQSISTTLANFAKFSEGLAANSDGLASFMENAGEIAKSLDGLSSRLSGTIARAEQILEAVDTEQVRKTIANVESFSTTIADQREDIAKLVDSAREATERLNTASQTLDTTIKRVGEVAGAVDPEQVATLLKELQGAATRANNLVASVDAITTRRTLDDLSQTVARARALIEGVDPNAVTKVVEDVTGTVERARTIVEAVDPAAVTSAVDGLTNASREAAKVISAIDSDKINSAVEDVSSAASSARRVIDGVDPQVVQRTLDDISNAATAARGLLEGIDQAAVQNLLTELNTASRNIGELVAGVDANQVNKAVDNISQAASGARDVVEDVRRVTERVGSRADDVEGIITDTAALASRLNKTSERLDSVIFQIEALFEGGGGNGIVNDVRETLASFRQTANNLDRRLAEATRNISQVTERGLRDTQTLLRSAGQSLNRVDRVIRNLQNNPSALITGAGGNRVRETGSRRPRR